MSPLEQLIMKKMQEGKQMSPLEQKAKMSNLDSLKSEMQDMMKGHLDGKDGMDGAKVEIASDSPEGLKDGLDKAQDLMSPSDDSSDDSSDDDSDEQGDDMPEHDMADAGHDDAQPDMSALSPTEMQQLQMLLAKLKS